MTENHNGSNVQISCLSLLFALWIPMLMLLPQYFFLHGGKTAFKHFCASSGLLMPTSGPHSEKSGYPNPLFYTSEVVSGQTNAEGDPTCAPLAGHAHDGCNNNFCVPDPKPLQIPCNSPVWLRACCTQVNPARVWVLSLSGFNISNSLIKVNERQFVYTSSTNLAVLSISSLAPQGVGTHRTTSSPKLGEKTLSPLILSRWLPHFSSPQAAGIAEGACHRFIAVSNKHIWWCI